MTLLAPQQLRRIESISSTELEDRLTHGSITGVLFVGCSEVGLQLPGIPTNPQLPTYILQNLGGCINEPKSLPDLIRDSRISDIVVYGHYPCSFLEMALNNDRMPLSLSETRRYMDQEFSIVVESIEQRFGDRRDAAVFRKASELHVHNQLIKLMNFLALTFSDKQPILHGWMWNGMESELLCFDPAACRFN